MRYVSKGRMVYRIANQEDHHRPNVSPPLDPVLGEIVTSQLN